MSEKHAGGRPRTVSYTPQEMIELGEEMVEFVKENKPIHLSHWYTREKHFTYNQWQTMSVAPEFLPYYEEALSYVGENYLNSNIHPSIAQRWQRVYFKDLKKEENNKKQEELDMEYEHKIKLITFEIQAKNQISVSVPHEHVEAFTDMMEKFNAAQSARKSDAKIDNNACKS